MRQARPTTPGRRRTATLIDVGELRFRLAMRRLRSRGGAADAIAQALLYVLALPIAIAFAAVVALASYRAARAGHGVQATVPVTAVLYGLWQTWTAVSLTMNERGALDLRRLLQYPVHPGRLYLLGLVASLVADPFALFWLVLLGGVVSGAAAARPGAWVFLLIVVLAAFAAATVALVALLQELLARIARKRRWRELAALIALVAWLGIVFSTSGGTQTLRAARPVFQVLRWVLYPAAFATEAAKPLYAGHVLGMLPWLAILAAAAVATGWIAYRVALATALSGGEAGSAGVTAEATRRRWLWPEVVGPLLEKEILYLSRHPAARIYLLLLPALAALLGWKIPDRAAGDLAGLLSVLPLFGLAAYVHLALQMFWVNALGWERGGARTLFLAPVAPERVLAAKNVALAIYATLLFGVAAGAYVAVAGPPPRWAVVGAIVLELGLAPVLYGLGNVVTVLMPRAAPFGLQRAGAISAVATLVGMGITSGAVAVFALPVLAALWLDTLWIIPAAWAALAAAGAVAWRLTLPVVGDLLARRKEEVLAAVCGDEA